MAHRPLGCRVLDRDRLAFGQSLVVTPYLTVRRTDPRYPAEQVQLRVVGRPSGHCDSGQVPRRTAKVQVPSVDLPAWVGPASRFDLGVIVGGVPMPVIGDAVLSPDELASDESGVTALALESPDGLLRRHGVLRSRVLQGSARGALGALVRETLPGAVVASRGVRDVALHGYEVDGGQDSRWRAIAELAAMMGAEIGATAVGGLWLRPTGDASPPWVIREGRQCSTYMPSRAAQPNIVIIEGQAPDGEPPAVGVAVDDRPWSPGYLGPGASHYAIDGRAGMAQPGFAPPFTRYEQLPSPSSTDARLAAHGLLVRGVRASDSTLTLVADPSLEWGRRLTYLPAATSGAPASALVLVSFDLPFGQPTLSATVRSE